MGGGGPGEIEPSTLAPRLSPTGQAVISGFEYKRLDEVRRELPDRLELLPSSDIVPAGQRDVEGQRIQEVARCMLGGDGNVYVVRYRDTHRKRLLRRNALRSQEAVVAYKGKSLAAAAAAMDAARLEFSEAGDVQTGTLMKVGGATASGRNPKILYYTKPLLKSLDEMLEASEGSRQGRPVVDADPVVRDTARELVVVVEGEIGRPQSDRTKRILEHFGLEI
jgi:hypothetical protein